MVSKSKKDSKKSNKKKLFLIDGNGLAYRAFYAVVPIHTESGVPINALAGFVNMVLRLLKTQKPQNLPRLEPLPYSLPPGHTP